MAEAVDVLVVGAGVIGLACARALALTGRDVLVLERHDRIGAETSSRNSEVIHAGIYYPTGSRRATLCVAGKALLYRYCAERSVPLRRCGKLIVATEPEQIPVLVQYREQARQNAAGDLQWLDETAVRALEPEVRAVAGLLSESTGILDSHAYLQALEGDLRAAGGALVLRTAVTSVALRRDGLRVVTPGLELAPRWLLNCAGLAAPDLAASVCADAPRAYYARGQYYAYSGRAPFRRLVYPIAEAGGLGVHVTLDMAGQVRFGPDVQWLDQPDYRFDDRHRARFVAAIRRYYPGLDARRLHPGYTGIRPKLAGPGEPAADFRIDGPAEHGVAGLVNLMGIESPGLTASLAIAAQVAQIVTGQPC